MSPAARVLIVEDERIVTFDLQQRLQEIGFTVCGTASRGDEAVRMARELSPDIVLMDIYLEGDMEGVAAAHAMRAELKLPVVFLTAYADEATVGRAQETLPYGYLTKPCESRTLYATLQTALVRHASELEASNRELESRVEQLALASKYKSEFLSNMSHELRTPLVSVLALSGLLADNREGNLTDKQVRHANIIHRAGQGLLEIINDLLDLAAIEAGRLVPEARPTRLAALCDEMERMFRPLAAEQGLSFAVSLAPGLPQDIHTDGGRLRQVLRSLLGNAFKFTHSGEVRLELARCADDLSFCVYDSGIGIPSDHLALIFEAFQQTDGSSTRRYGGTGLGLSICRQLAPMLGGRIEVESTPGVGSRFTVLLPLQTQERPEPSITLDKV